MKSTSDCMILDDIYVKGKSPKKRGLARLHKTSFCEVEILT